MSCSEYGRKKKTAFYSVVAKGTIKFEAIHLATAEGGVVRVVRCAPVCRQLEGPSAEEQSLSRWEQQRLSKRKAEGVREEEDEGSPGSFTMPSSEDSDADFEANLLEVMRGDIQVLCFYYSLSFTNTGLQPDER